MQETIQTILTYTIVVVAAIYAGLKFFRQFAQGDDQPKCSKCAGNLNAPKGASQKSALPQHIRKFKQQDKQTLKNPQL